MRLDRIRIAQGIQSSIDRSSSAFLCLEASVTSTRHRSKPVVPSAQQCCAPSGDTLSSVATVHEIITASYPSSWPLFSV